MSDVHHNRTDTSWHAPYGLPEKIWLAAWGTVFVGVLIGYGHLEPYTRAISMVTAALAANIILPQITFRLGAVAQSLGRACLSLVTALGGYETSALVIQSLELASYEWTMIQIDDMLFGLQPSVAIQAIQNPVLTEYLQAIYMFYFPNMLLVGLAMIYARNHRLFYEYVACLNTSFLVTHFLYVIVPLQSPFLIAEQGLYPDFIYYETPLAGLWFTEGFRQSLLNATTMRFDCFPSGHTMHSLIALFYAWRVRRDLGWVVTLFVASIVFSTVYLRYHYAVDVVVGIVLATAIYAVIYPLAKRTWKREAQPAETAVGWATLLR